LTYAARVGIAYLYSHFSGESPKQISVNLRMTLKQTKMENKFTCIKYTWIQNFHSHVHGSVFTYVLIYIFNLYYEPVWSNRYFRWSTFFLFWFNSSSRQWAIKRCKFVNRNGRHVKLEIKYNFCENNNYLFKQSLFFITFQCALRKDNVIKFMRIVNLYCKKKYIKRYT
jgi:hypothetical protein